MSNTRRIFNIARNEEDEPDMTCDTDVVLQRVTSYWQAMWTDSGINRDEYLEAIIENLDYRTTWDLSDIDAEAVREAVKTSKGTHGPDGWRAAEIVKLGPSSYQEIADIYKLMEQTAILPQSFTHIDISLIPKEGGSSHYTQLRPISVSSLFWRIYGKIRLQRDILPEQEVLFGEAPLYGTRVKHCCRQATSAVGYKVEERAIRNEVVFVICYDLRKAYDRINTKPSSLLWVVLQKLGWHVKVINVMKSSWRIDREECGSTRVWGRLWRVRMISEGCCRDAVYPQSWSIM